MQPGSTRARGQAHERRAEAHLRAHGLRIVARNVEIGGAELDLIARAPDGDGDTIVFVEVRGRTRDRLGDPLETVDARKQRQIIRAATAWLIRQNLWERVAVRFDVVGITGADDDPTPRIAWIQDAFGDR